MFSFCLPSRSPFVVSFLMTSSQPFRCKIVFALPSLLRWSSCLHEIRKTAPNDEQKGTNCFQFGVGRRPKPIDRPLISAKRVKCANNFRQQKAVILRLHETEQLTKHKWPNVVSARGENQTLRSITSNGRSDFPNSFSWCAAQPMILIRINIYRLSLLFDFINCSLWISASDFCVLHFLFSLPFSADCWFAFQTLVPQISLYYVEIPITKPALTLPWSSNKPIAISLWFDRVYVAMATPSCH